MMHLLVGLEGGPVPHFCHQSCNGSLGQESWQHWTEGQMMFACKGMAMFCGLRGKCIDWTNKISQHIGAGGDSLWAWSMVRQRTTLPASPLLPQLHLLRKLQQCL